MAWLLTVPRCPATSVVWALHVVVSQPASSLACCLGDVAVRWRRVRGDERHGDERLKHGRPLPTLWTTMLAVVVRDGWWWWWEGKGWSRK